MKKILIVAFVLFFNHFSYAQAEKDSIDNPFPPSWAIKVGININNDISTNIRMSYFFDKRYSINSNYWHFSRTSPNSPPDFVEQNLFGHKYRIKESFFAYGLLIGYLIEISDTGLRLHLQTGILYNLHFYPDNFVRLDPPHDTLFSYSNYEYERKSEYYPSWIIDAPIEIPLGNYIGASMGPKLHISKKGVTFWVCMSLNFGNVTSKVLP